MNKQLIQLIEDMVRVIPKHEELYSQYEFVLKYGCLYEPAIKPKNVRLGVPKHCFHNAQKLARRFGYKYVEGYAISCEQLPIPIHHAWCVRAGKVIDPTWETVGVAYFGVAFDLSFVLDQIRGNKFSISVIDNYEKRWPILRKDKAEDNDASRQNLWWSRGQTQP